MLYNATIWNWESKTGQGVGVSNRINPARSLIILGFQQPCQIRWMRIEASCQFSNPGSLRNSGSLQSDWKWRASPRSRWQGSVCTQTRRSLGVSHRLSEGHPTFPKPKSYTPFHQRSNKQGIVYFYTPIVCDQWCKCSFIKNKTFL